MAGVIPWQKYDSEMLEVARAGGRFPEEISPDSDLSYYDENPTPIIDWGAAPDADDLAEDGSAIPSRPLTAESIAQAQYDINHPASTKEQYDLARKYAEQGGDLDARLAELMKRRSATINSSDPAQPGTLQRLQAARARLEGRTLPGSSQTDRINMLAGADSGNGTWADAAGNRAAATLQHGKDMYVAEGERDDTLLDYDATIGKAQTGDIDAQIEQLQKALAERSDLRQKFMGMRPPAAGTTGATPTSGSTTHRTNVNTDAELTTNPQITGQLEEVKQLFSLADKAWAEGNEFSGPTSAQAWLNTTGPLTDRIFGAGTGEAVKRQWGGLGDEIRQKAERVVQLSLRPILGAQFTKVEGENVLARAYDVTKPWPVNRARINAIRRSLERMQLAHDKLAAIVYQGDPTGQDERYKQAAATLEARLIAEMEADADVLAAEYHVGEGVEPPKRTPGTGPTKVQDGPKKVDPLATPAPVKVKPAKPSGPSVWDRISPFAKGGQVRGYAEAGAVQTEEYEYNGLRFPAPVGASPEEVMSAYEFALAGKKGRKEALGDLAWDAASAGVTGVGAGATAALGAGSLYGIAERIPWEKNPLYLSPGDRALTDKIGRMQPDKPGSSPSLRPRDIPDRMAELQGRYGLPNSNFLQATPDSLRGVFTGALQTPENRMLTPFRNVTGRQQRQMQQHDTPSMLAADMNSQGPYRERKKAIEGDREKAFRPQFEAAVKKTPYVKADAMNADTLMMNDPDFQTQLTSSQAAWEKMDPKKSRSATFNEINDDFTPGKVTGYDTDFLYTLHRDIGQAIRDLSGSAAKDATTSAKMRNLMALNARLENVMWANAPGLKDANSTFREYSELLDALKIGAGEDLDGVQYAEEPKTIGNNPDGTPKTVPGAKRAAVPFSKMRDEELRLYLKNIENNPGAMDSLKSGVADYMQEQAKKAELKSIFGNDESGKAFQGKLRILFENDPDALRQLLEDVGVHRDARATLSRARTTAETTQKGDTKVPKTSSARGRAKVGKVAGDVGTAGIRPLIRALISGGEKLKASDEVKLDRGQAEDVTRRGMSTSQTDAKKWASAAESRLLAKKSKGKLGAAVGISAGLAQLARRLMDDEEIEGQQ